jgi:hypothetical protein
MLATAAQSIIAGNYWSKPPNAFRTPAIETEYLATLIAGCISPIAQAWGNILHGSGTSVTMRGAFLHQRPKVRFPSITLGSCGPHNCELADLMLVHDHQNIRRACLVQVKREPGPAVSGDQKLLYENWDTFRIGAGNKGAKGHPYSIAPNLDGGMYGIVRTHPLNGQHPWEIRHPKGATGAIDLGSYLAELLVSTVDGFSTAGRIGNVNGKGDDWSRLVYELLSMSFKNNYKLNGFWPRQRYRHFDHIMYLNSNIFSDGGDFESFGSSENDWRRAFVDASSIGGDEPPVDSGFDGDDQGRFAVIYIKTGEYLG